MLNTVKITLLVSFVPLLWSSWGIELVFSNMVSSLNGTFHCRFQSSSNTPLKYLLEFNTRKAEA